MKDPFVLIAQYIFKYMWKMFIYSKFYVYDTLNITFSVFSWALPLGSYQPTNTSIVLKKKKWNLHGDKFRMCSILNNILFASNVNLCMAFLFKIFLKTFSHNTKKLKRNYFNMIDV